GNQKLHCRARFGMGKHRRRPVCTSQRGNAGRGDQGLGGVIKAVKLHSNDGLGKFRLKIFHFHVNVQRITWKEQDNGTFLREWAAELSRKGFLLRLARAETGCSAQLRVTSRSRSTRAYRRVCPSDEA